MRAYENNDPDEGQWVKSFSVICKEKLETKRSGPSGGAILLPDDDDLWFSSANSGIFGVSRIYSSDYIERTRSIIV